jgi:hypothetical protein
MSIYSGFIVKYQTFSDKIRYILYSVLQQNTSELLNYFYLCNALWCAKLRDSLNKK